MKRILIASQVGNPGKSVIAQALAVECKNSGLNLSLIDIDPEHRTGTKWSNQRNESEIEPTIAIFSPNSTQEALSIITEDVLQILDAPSRATNATLLLAKSSDLIIIPTTPSKKDIDLNLTMVSQLIQNGIPSYKIVIIFNRVGSTYELNCAIAYIRMAFDSSNLPVLDSALWEKVGYRSATNDGYAITETSFETLNNSAKIAIYQLLARLVD